MDPAGFARPDDWPPDALPQATLGTLDTIGGLQHVGLGLSTTALPLCSMSQCFVDRTVPYAGGTAHRLHEVIPTAGALARRRP